MWQLLPFGQWRLGSDGFNEQPSELFHRRRVRRHALRYRRLRRQVLPIKRGALQHRGEPVGGRTGNGIQTLGAASATLSELPLL